MLDVGIMVEDKYLSKFWRIFEIPKTNFEISLK